MSASCVYCGYDITPCVTGEWITDDERGEETCHYSMDGYHHRRVMVDKRTPKP